MAGYKADGAGKAVILSTEAIDSIVEAMEDATMKMEELQGKVVKLRNAEVACLQQFEAARDYMMELLQRPDEGRENLQKIFGGDCIRIAQIRTCLDSAKFSDMYKGDQRHPDCANACESVEKVLHDLGLGAALRAAMESQKEVMRKRKTVALGIGDVQQIQALAGAAQLEQVEVPIVVEETLHEPEPKAKVRRPPKKKDMASEAVARTTDEGLIERILACTSAAELAEITPPERAQLGDWMIWMVHRAHLNDPTLDKFDFTNMPMPPGKEEPRIAPKLMKAIATNTIIESLLLANTRLQAIEGKILAESLAINTHLKILNIDSNFLRGPELEAVAQAAGTNQTIEELRVNNQHGVMLGKPTFEAFSNAIKENKMICKLGLSIDDAHFRREIDKNIMSNSDDKRKRRVTATKAAEGQ